LKKKKLTKAEVLEDIKRISSKIKYAKNYCMNRRYPKEARDRFSIKIGEYDKQLKVLQTKLKKFKGKDEELPAIVTPTENPAVDIYDIDEISSDDREEIDFDDNKKILDTLTTLYPDGLDLD
jgi:hypothetical protein